MPNIISTKCKEQKTSFLLLLLVCWFLLFAIHSYTIFVYATLLQWLGCSTTVQYKLGVMLIIIISYLHVLVMTDFN